MRTLNNAKHHTICLKFEDRIFTSLTTIELEAKASICSTIKENLILYCRKFSAFSVAVINQHILITKSVSRRNSACKINR